MAKQGPLSGLKIIEFDGIGPVPIAAKLLAEMGAELTRIVRPPHKDAAWDEVGGKVLHRARESVVIDLKSEKGIEQALMLVEGADALLEGFRPGVMERLGLGPEACHDINPALVYTRLTGWGQDGPLSLRAGHDLNYIAITGVLRALGPPDSAPPVPLNMIGDYAGGAMFGIVGLLAGLMQARHTGQGQIVDAAITDGVASLSALFFGLAASGEWSEQRGENLLDGSAPFYRCYECSDGEFVAVGALEPQFFSQLIAGLGLMGENFCQHDKKIWPRMIDTFSTIFLKKTRDEWAAIFADTDACVSPVLSFKEAAEYPHNRSRKTFINTDSILQPGLAPRFTSASDKKGEKSK